MVTYQIASPDPKIFRNKYKSSSEQVLEQTGISAVLESVDYSQPQGIYCKFKDKAFLEKGFPHPSIAGANNQLKRLTMIGVVFVQKEFLLASIGFLLTPFRWKITWLEKLLTMYARTADWIMNPFYLEDRYYTPCAHELQGITSRFLIEIGITPDLATRIGLIVATLVEYDSAYRLRIEDILSETNKEKLIAQPRKELKFLVNLIIERGKAFELDNVEGKFVSIGKLISFLLLSPRLKKAFRQALVSCEFSNLQLDESDRYACLLHTDYDFFGLSSEQRMLQYTDIHRQLGTFPTYIKVIQEFNN